MQCMNDDHDDDASHDLRRWLGDEDAPARAIRDAGDDPSRRWTAPRTALALLVAAPWVVLMALAVTGAAGPSTTTTSTDGAGTAAAATHRPVAPTDGTATPSAGPPVDPRSGDAPPASDARPEGDASPAAVGPTAVRVVRDAVTRTGARSMALDAAAVEAVDTLAAGTWAVRVHAVVLRGDRRRWRTASHEIWVAPVGLHDGRVVGLDRPWRVATLDGDIAQTTWGRADVDTRAVLRALDEAGIARGDDLVAEQHPTVPSIVRVTTTGTRRVWVRLTPEPVVVGLDDAGHDR